jgi:hypothetical protein
MAFIGQAALVAGPLCNGLQYACYAIQGANHAIKLGEWFHGQYGFRNVFSKLGYPRALPGEQRLSMNRVTTSYARLSARLRSRFPGYSVRLEVCLQTCVHAKLLHSNLSSEAPCELHLLYTSRCVLEFGMSMNNRSLRCQMQLTRRISRPTESTSLLHTCPSIS